MSEDARGRGGKSITEHPAPESSGRGETDGLGSRLMLFILLFGMLLVALGTILYLWMTRLLEEDLKQTVAREARHAAAMYEEQLDASLRTLGQIAHILETEDPGGKEQSIRNAVAYMEQIYRDEPGVTVGILRGDASPVYGAEIPLQEYKGFTETLRGEPTMCYASSGGLLLSWPVLHGDKVEFVLYELRRAVSVFRSVEPRLLDGTFRFMILTRDGDVAVPFENITPEELRFYEDPAVREVFRRLNRGLGRERSAVTLERTSRGKLYLFSAEIGNTDLLLSGTLEQRRMAKDKGRIAVLALAMFILMASVVMVMAVWLLQVSGKVRESEELLRAKAVAEKASRAKSDFLANMSHEIRTPINAVLGMDELILRECEDPTLRQYAINIRNSGNTLLNLVNDVLDFSKIEAGKLELLPDSYDLSVMIEDLVCMVRSRAVKKHLTLEIEVDRQMPHHLYGDEIRLKQVIMNLLTNAVKYTKRGGVFLTVGHHRIDGGSMYLDVSVRDTGIGMKQEDLDRIFSPFERFDENENRTIEGAGLGMSIVRQLLGLMGTELRAESVYGEGSVFSFSVFQEVEDWEPIGDYEESFERAISREGSYHASFTAPEAHVLLVDDTELNLMVGEGLLKQTLMKVDTAVSGQEALALTLERSYDILLIDHRMPGMDGIELLRRIRSDEANPNRARPAIALTANAVAGAREQYLGAGFDDYLTKPVNGSRLESTILKYLPLDKVNAAQKVYDEQRATREVPLSRVRERLEKEVQEENSRSSLLGTLVRLDQDGVINLREGIDYAGSEDMFMQTLRFYRDKIDARAEELDRLFSEQDWENYTIKVHALKSTSRLIGAAALSDQARLLEKAGKEGDISYIRQHHRAAMVHYRSYGELLVDV